MNFMDKIKPEIWPEDLWQMACKTTFKIEGRGSSVTTLTPFGSFAAGCGVGCDAESNLDKIGGFLRAMADAVEYGTWGDVSTHRGWRWGKISLKTGEEVVDEARNP